MKLNLGCGKDLKAGYFNIDIQRPCDLIHDLRKPLPYKDNSIDEIFSQGFITIFSRKEWRELKKEMVRVLKPKGKLELICHNFEYVLKNFLANTDGERWDWWLQSIFAAQLNEYDYNKNGFTYDKLISDLKEEGMINFEKNESNPEYIHLTSYKQIL